MRTRAEIKNDAKVTLKKNYGLVLGTVLLAGVLIGATTSIGIGIFLTPVLIVGLYVFLLKTVRYEDSDTGDIFSAFNKFGQALAAYLLEGILILAWSLLFIIPGIIKAFSYIYTMFIVAESDIRARDAIKVSMAITKGRKWDIFVFGLSFLGWILLGTLTFHILTVVYVMPYYCLAFTQLYIEMKQDAIDNGIISEEFEIYQ